MGEQSRRFYGNHCRIEWRKEAKEEAKFIVPTRWNWMQHNNNPYLNQSVKPKKETTVVQLGWWGLQCQSIIFILLIFFVFIGAVDYVDRIDSINCINHGDLYCSLLKLKYNSNDPTNYGINFWVKKGEILKLLEFTSICKYFTRYFQ